MAKREMKENSHPERLECPGCDSSSFTTSPSRTTRAAETAARDGCARASAVAALVRTVLPGTALRGARPAQEPSPRPQAHPSGRVPSEQVGTPDVRGVSADDRRPRPEAPPARKTDGGQAERPDGERMATLPAPGAAAAFRGSAGTDVAVESVWACGVAAVDRQSTNTD